MASSASLPAPPPCSQWDVHVCQKCNETATSIFPVFTATERGTRGAPVHAGGYAVLTSNLSVWSPRQSCAFHCQLCLYFVSGFPQRRYFGLSASSVPSTRTRNRVCIVVQILLALATAQSFERRLISDVALVPALHFVSAEAGTDSMESPCVRQLTQAMKRLQKVNHDYATISHKRLFADMLAASQWIAKIPNVRSFSV